MSKSDSKKPIYNGHLFTDHNHYIDYINKHHFKFEYPQAFKDYFYSTDLPVNQMGLIYKVWESQNTKKPKKTKVVKKTKKLTKIKKTDKIKE